MHKQQLEPVIASAARQSLSVWHHAKEIAALRP